MLYAEFRPRPELAPFIRCFWTLEGASGGGGAERVLPDGCVEFVVNYGEPFEQLADDGAVVRQPHGLLVGPTTRAMLIRPSGAVGIIGIRFLPGGAHPFLAAPAGELSDHALELSRLTAIPASMAERLAELPAAHHRVRVIQEVLVTILHRSAAPRAGWRDGVTPAVRLILASGGRVSVDVLASTQGIGHRQLARRFVATVGVGPKLLCRLTRFQSVMALIAEGRPRGWTEVALRCGYYDQAHFVREFREFAGTSPTAYAGSAHEMSDHFIGAEAGMGDEG